MENILAIISDTDTLCTIVLGLITILVITVIVLTVFIRNLNYNFCVVRTMIEDLNEDIQNISRASKRIERMSDAVNQRTRAHLISKEVNKSKYSSVTKTAKTKNTGKLITNKKGGKKDAHLFKSTKKTDSFSFIDSSATIIN